MTTAEVTSQTKTEVSPNFQKKVFVITGTGATNSDYLTMTGLTTVDFAVFNYYNSTTGPQWTVSGNVVTFANIGTAVVYGIICGNGGVVATS